MDTVFDTKSIDAKDVIRRTAYAVDPRCYLATALAILWPWYVDMLFGPQFDCGSVAVCEALTDWGTKSASMVRMVGALGAFALAWGYIRRRLAMRMLSGACSE